MVTMHSASTHRSEEWAVGCTVRLLTTLDETIEGTVFAYDRLSNCLTLTQEGALPGTVDFRVLKASCVKSILLATRPETPVDFTLPPIDLAPLMTEQTSTPPRSVEEEHSIKEDTSWQEPELEQEEEEPVVEVEKAKVLPVAQGVWGKPRGPIVDPQPAPEPRPRRDDPWGTAKPSISDPPKAAEPPATLSYANVSKGVSRASPVPSPVPQVPPAAPQAVPQGPWGVKNPRITSKMAYAQVASNNAASTPTTQPEPAKTGTAAGMVTMSLKPRSATRH